MKKISKKVLHFYFWYVIIQSQFEIGNNLQLEKSDSMREDIIEKIKLTKARKKQCVTLCWKCQHAVPTETTGCSWSRFGQVVEGAEGFPMLIDSHKFCRDSFIVTSCPQFLED